MAVNILLRRGTAAEWTSANPILLEGEVGVETDTKKLKVGDGLTVWASLPYITLTPAAAATLYAPLANPTFTGTVSLDTGVNLVFEGATANAFETTLAVTDPTADRTLTLPDSTGTVATQEYVTTEIGTHSSDTTSVHGIADTADLATKTYADTAVSTHSSDTTSVHGITDTAELATKTYADNAAATAISTSLSTHTLDTVEVHGIADTSLLVTTTGTQTLTNKTITTPAGLVKSDVGLGNVDNTSDANKPVSTAQQTALDLKANLSGPTFTGTVGGITKSMVGLGNVDNTADADKPISTDTQTALDLKAPKADPTFTGTLVLPSTVNGPSISTSVNLLFPTQGGHITLGGSQTTGNLTLGGGATRTTGVIGIGTGATTSGTKTINVGTGSTGGTTEITIGSSSGATSNITLNGSVTAANNLVVEGDFTVNGTNFSASATSITIEDNMLQLAHQNAANTVDLGLVVAYNDGAAKHAGLVRDVSDSTWKLFKGVTTEPATTVDFTQGSLDDLAVAGLTASSLTVGSVSSTEIGYLDGVTSAIQTQINNKAPIASPTFTGTVTVAADGIAFTDGTQTAEGVPSRTPIIQKTASYTLSSLTERDDLIEMSSSSAMTLTIPLNSAVAFPVGTSIDILQTSTGQVTIAGDAGVTVNATPGLKLRTQWSSATLFKRAENTWVVFGDLTA
jgi:hypothetical protein